MAGYVAFEAVLGFSGGLALGDSFGDVGLGFGAAANAGESDGVERSVRRLRRWRVFWPEDASMGATSVRRANAASLPHRPGCDQEM